MNCHYFQEHLYDLLANECNAEERRALEAHAAECPACRAALAERRAALAAVTPRLEITIPDDMESRLRERLRNTIDSASARPAATSPRKLQRRWQLFAGTLSAAAVIAVALLFGLNTPVRAARNSLDRAIHAMHNVQSLRIGLHIRTSANENFDYTSPDAELLPHTIEACYTPRLLWRITKPGRTALYDGSHIYQWYGSGDGTINPYSPGIPGMLNQLIDPSQLLDAERDLVSRSNGATYRLQNTGDRLRLTVETPAQGDYTQSDYARNSSIVESNTRREYLFDNSSGRLLAARVTLLTEAGETLLLEIDHIEYNAPIDPATLTALPETIAWNDLSRPTGTLLAGISPKQAAERILQAMIHWEEQTMDAALYLYGPQERQILRDSYAGAHPVRIGQPVQSGQYPGRFVPCVLRMPDGQSRKIMLALRNDYPGGAWVVDGGL